MHFSDKGLYVCVAKSPGKKTDAAAFLMVYGECIISFVYNSLSQIRCQVKMPANYNDRRALYE